MTCRRLPQQHRVPPHRWHRHCFAARRAFAVTTTPRPRSNALPLPPRCPPRPGTGSLPPARGDLASARTTAWPAPAVVDARAAAPPGIATTASPQRRDADANVSASVSSFGLLPAPPPTPPWVEVTSNLVLHRYHTVAIAHSPGQAETLLRHLQEQPRPWCHVSRVRRPRLDDVAVAAWIDSVVSSLWQRECAAAAASSAAVAASTATPFLPPLLVVMDAERLPALALDRLAAALKDSSRLGAPASDAVPSADFGSVQVVLVANGAAVGTGCSTLTDAAAIAGQRFVMVSAPVVPPDLTCCSGGGGGDQATEAASSIHARTAATPTTPLPRGGGSGGGGDQASSSPLLDAVVAAMSRCVAGSDDACESAATDRRLQHLRQCLAWLRATTVHAEAAVQPRALLDVVVRPPPPPAASPPTHHRRDVGVAAALVKVPAPAPSPEVGLVGRWSPTVTALLDTTCVAPCGRLWGAPALATFLEDAVGRIAQDGAGDDEADDEVAAGARRVADAVLGVQAFHLDYIAMPGATGVLAFGARFQLRGRSPSDVGVVPDVAIVNLVTHRVFRSNDDHDPSCGSPRAPAPPGLVWLYDPTATAPAQKEAGGNATTASDCYRRHTLATVEPAGQAHPASIEGQLDRAAWRVQGDEAVPLSGVALGARVLISHRVLAVDVASAAACLPSSCSNAAALLSARGLGCNDAAYREILGGGGGGGSKVPDTDDSDRGAPTALLAATTTPSTPPPPRQRVELPPGTVCRVVGSHREPHWDSGAASLPVVEVLSLPSAAAEGDAISLLVVVGRTLVIPRITLHVGGIGALHGYQRAVAICPLRCLDPYVPSLSDALEPTLSLLPDEATPRFDLAAFVARYGGANRGGAHVLSALMQLQPSARARAIQAIAQESDHDDDGRCCSAIASLFGWPRDAAAVDERRKGFRPDDLGSIIARARKTCAAAAAASTDEAPLNPLFLATQAVIARHPGATPAPTMLQQPAVTRRRESAPSWESYAERWGELRRLLPWLPRHLRQQGVDGAPQLLDERTHRLSSSRSMSQHALSGRDGWGSWMPAGDHAVEPEILPPSPLSGAPAPVSHAVPMDKRTPTRRAVASATRRTPALPTEAPAATSAAAAVVTSARSFVRRAKKLLHNAFAAGEPESREGR